MLASNAWRCLSEHLGDDAPSLEDVAWFHVQEITGPDGAKALGLWEYPNRIYLTTEAEWVLRHELTHYATKDSNHDNQAFEACR